MNLTTPEVASKGLVQLKQSGSEGDGRSGAPPFAMFEALKSPVDGDPK